MLLKLISAAFAFGSSVVLSTWNNTANATHLRFVNITDGPVVSTPFFKPLDDETNAPTATPAKPLKSIYQPKVVLTIESAHRMFGSLSQPQGSPWCNGMPTYWLIGHQKYDETPYCLSEEQQPSNSTTKDLNVVKDYQNYDYSQDGVQFVKPRYVTLDVSDALNGGRIDRHDCTSIDVDYDGILDIVCGVGADKGTGSGYTELYLTTILTTQTPTNGTTTTEEAVGTAKIQKVLRGHGLQKFPSTRSRLVKSLRGPSATTTSDLLFIATHGEPRSDHLPNSHRLYRNVYSSLTHAKDSDSPAATAQRPVKYFEVVRGPWEKEYTLANCLLTVDLNQDGMDDILLCNLRHTALIYLQFADGTFSSLPLPTDNGDNNEEEDMKWRQARVADMTGDGRVDLIVVGFGQSPYDRSDDPTSLSYVRIYAGIAVYPYFDFQTPFYERSLPYGTPDLEILDVNQDGYADIYVVQTDEITPDTYCAGVQFNNRDWWPKGNEPPASFVPPLDTAPDILLLANPLYFPAYNNSSTTNDGPTTSGRTRNINKKSSKKLYTEVRMKHSKPGCGFYTQLFGNNRTMILSQGTNSRPGHSLLLQW